MIDEAAAIGRAYALLKEVYGSVTAGCVAMGIPQSSISSAYSRGTINYLTIASIMTMIPEVSPDWLILGEGEKYRSTNGELQRTTRYIKDVISRQEEHRIELDHLFMEYNADIKELRHNHNR